MGAVLRRRRPDRTCAACLGRNVAIDGYSKPYIAAVCYGSAVYGFLALLLSIAAARRLGLDATASTAAIWFGTPLLFYMYVAPPMAHACSAFAVALLVSIWLRVRTTWSVPGMMALGAVTALTGMVREQDVLLACGPALDCCLWALGTDGGTKPRPGVRALVPRALAALVIAVIVYVPQALAYIALNGHLGPTRLVMRKMTWTAPHGLQVLLSPEHGFLVWTPLAILGIAGLVWMALRGVTTAPVESQYFGRVAACMLLMIALQVYSAGSVESWTVAGAFGQRRFVAITSLLVIGLAALQHRMSSTSSPATPQSRHRGGGLLESGVDGGVRHGIDGPPAARARAQRVRCLRDGAQDGARSRVPVSVQSRVVLQNRTLTCGFCISPTSAFLSSAPMAFRPWKRAMRWRRAATRSRWW